MNLQKRDCSIKFELKSCISGEINVSLHIGNDVHNMIISHLSGDNINTLLEALILLNSEYNISDNRCKYTEYQKSQNENRPTFEWKSGSISTVWKIKKYPNSRENFNIIVELVTNNDADEKLYTYKVDYRDLCYAVASLCTRIIKNCGFLGYFNSYRAKDIDICNLLFIKSYALKTESLMDFQYSDKFLCCSNINNEFELLIFDMDKEIRPKQYDSIDVVFEPENNCEEDHFFSGTRANIVINGQDFLDIITEQEKKIFSNDDFKKRHHNCTPGNYNYLVASELYMWLYDSAQSNGEDGAYLFSCGECDETGCWSVLVDVIYTKDSVVWKNFRSVGGQWRFDMKYEFKISQYEHFMQKINIKDE